MGHNWDFRPAVLHPEQDRCLCPSRTTDTSANNQVLSSLPPATGYVLSPCPVQTGMEKGWGDGGTKELNATPSCYSLTLGI